MTFGQIKSFITTMDINKGKFFNLRRMGKWQRIEWILKNLNYTFNYCGGKEKPDLYAEQVKKCFAGDLNQFDSCIFRNLSRYDDSVFEVIFLMMDGEEKITFMTIFFKKSRPFIETICDDNLLWPWQLYCTLSITSQRKRHVWALDESELHIFATKSNKRIYFGQQTHLTPVWFILVAIFYNFFADCEIPCDDGIVEKADFVRAAWYSNLPFLYAPFIV